MSSERAPEMGAAPSLVSLSAASKPTQVEVVGDRIRVASLEIVDRALAGYLESRSPNERPETIERALRVGLMALQSASGSIDVDHVRRAFDKLLSDAAESNKKATVEVEDGVVRVLDPHRPSALAAAPVPDQHRSGLAVRQHDHPAGGRQRVDELTEAE